MTTHLNGDDIARQISGAFPQAVIESNPAAVVIQSNLLFKIVEYLKNNNELSLDYLTDLTSVDYQNYFEIVYRLSSLKNNSIAVLKTRCYDREKATVPSITSLFRGADLLEREIFDLMGINFSGHPNMKRIFLWEGFEGYPLRKDYL
jgi:NADH-quinone oxidoreductase subunit C